MIDYRRLSNPQTFGHAPRDPFSVGERVVIADFDGNRAVGRVIVTHPTWSNVEITRLGTVAGQRLRVGHVHTIDHRHRGGPRTLVTGEDSVEVVVRALPPGEKVRR